MGLKRACFFLVAGVVAVGARDAAGAGGVSPKKVLASLGLEVRGEVVTLQGGGGWRTVGLATSTQLSVGIASTGTGAFRIQAHGLGVEAQLVGADSTRVELQDGLLVFPRAYAGRDIIHSITAAGLEDYVMVDATTSAILRYEIALRDVAGLRLVTDTLELLDETGNPQLRVAPPYLVDSNGLRQSMTLTISGCDVDTNPAPPWGRAVVSPGASTCVLTVKPTGPVSYPAVVDPAWQTTSNLSTPRFGHTATLLQNGKLLVVGGIAANGPTKTSELFDPASATWATSGPLSTARYFHFASHLAGAQVLVGGGGSATSEVYDEMAGTFGQVETMQHPRSNATVSALPSGKLLVTGGADSTGQAQGFCESYNAATNQWGFELPMKTRRNGHVAATLMDGRILVAGGFGGDPNAPPGADVGLTSAEIFQEGTGWGPAASMAEARITPSATTLPDGSVLVALGAQTPAVKAAEVYSPTNNQWSYTALMPATPSAWPATMLLSNQCLLVAGGGTELKSETAVSLYDTKAKTWTAAAPLVDARVLHSGNLLGDGRVLVVGGAQAGKAIGTTELYALATNSSTCTTNCECASGFCVEGICCDKACDGGCQACGADGLCKAVAEGTDPKNFCADEGAAACGKNGACDGKGGCEVYPAATPCGKNGCDGANILTAECNGAGKCISSTKDCAPFLCDAMTNACVVKCKSIDDCTPPNVCSPDGACIAPPSDTSAPTDTGCGCEIADPAPPWFALGLGALGVVAVGARRRSRAPRSSRRKGA